MKEGEVIKKYVANHPFSLIDSHFLYPRFLCPIFFYLVSLSHFLLFGFLSRFLILIYFFHFLLFDFLSHFLLLGICIPFSFIGFLFPIFFAFSFPFSFVWFLLFHFLLCISLSSIFTYVSLDVPPFSLFICNYMLKQSTEVNKWRRGDLKKD